PRRGSLRAVERAVASVRDGLADAGFPHLERIERRRAALEASHETILLPRFEYSGDPADASVVETLEVRDACFASVSPRWGALLYALVRELSRSRPIPGELPQMLERVGCVEF